jgi:hypothetical protein
VRKSDLLAELTGVIADGSLLAELTGVIADGGAQDLWISTIGVDIIPCICSSQCVITYNIKLFSLTHLFFIV